MNNNQVQLVDHFGTPLNIGDVVLGAKGGNRFRGVEFNVNLVVGRTKQLVQVRRILLTSTKKETLLQLEWHYKKIRGGVHPSEFIRLIEGYATPQEVKDALLKDSKQKINLETYNIQIPKISHPTPALSMSAP